MLAATNFAGAPDSHFHTPSIDRWKEVYGLGDVSFSADRDAVAAVFEAAKMRGLGDTKIFGLRVQRGSFSYFLQQLRVLLPNTPNDVARFKEMFGKPLFIHLTRKDRLDQAISRLRAEQTGLWHRRSDGTELERLSPPKPTFYDFDAIAKHMDELVELDDAWERWFRQERLKPLRINYEELSQDPQRSLGRILSTLGLDPKIASDIEIPTAKLADRESQDWRKRFLAES